MRARGAGKQAGQLDAATIAALLLAALAVPRHPRSFPPHPHLGEIMRNRDEWQARQATHERVDLPHNGYRAGVRGVTVGAIVVLDRKPWYVLEIKEKPEDLWPAVFEEAWQKKITAWVEYEAARLAGEPEHWGAPRKIRPQPIRAEWDHRPINLVLQAVDKPKSKPRHVGCPVGYEWQVIPEHYSVCRICRELPPCRHAETEKTISTEVAKAEELMAIPHGACMGCGEAITSRMKAIRFPGPNLLRPDWGNDSAVFHTRRREECSNGIWRYEQLWKAEGLDRLNVQPPLDA